MLIAMMYDCAGDSEFRPRPRDPALLRAMGYEAIVIPNALAAMPGTRDARASSGAQETTQPLAATETAIDSQQAAAIAVGMRVFFQGEALTLPRDLVERHPEWRCDDGSGRLCPGKDAVYAAMQDQAEALFQRWPEADGLVMRLAEPAADMPHLISTSLHAGGACPVCRDLSLMDRLARFIGAMHEAVVGRCGKVYIHRTGPGMPATSRDDPAFHQELSRRVPASDRLIFSYRFTHDDARQSTLWKLGHGADQHPLWIECPCEDECRGKGAFPDYQAPAWRGLLGGLMAAGMSAQQLHERVGIWGLSRAEGWGGPYPQRPEWIDANIRALADLYHQPDSEPSDVATRWVGMTFGIAESSPPAPALAELLLISAGALRKLLYVSAPLPQRDLADAPLRDDLLDVESLWVVAGRAVEAGVVAEAVAEKEAALEGVDRMRHLFDLAAPELPNRVQARDLAGTLAFLSSFAGAVAHLFIGFVRFHQWSTTGRADAGLAAQCRRHLESAQAHWQHHTQRHAMLPGAPSVLHENSLWQRTNGCLAAMEKA